MYLQLLVFLLSSLATVGVVFAENIGKQTEHLTADIGGVKVDYYVCKPASYNAAKKYPLIVNVPGVGANKGDVKKNQAVNYARRFLYTSGMKDAISMGVWYTGPLADHSGNSKAREATKKVMELVSQSYSIDPKRTYILGFSAGGPFLIDFVWGNYFTKDNFPFAGVMFCSANCWSTDKFSNKTVPRDLPVFIEVGDSEEIGGIEAQSRKLVDGLKKNGYTDVEFHVIKGQKHFISDADSKLPIHAMGLMAKWYSRITTKPAK
jgi:predicted esterase